MRNSGAFFAILIQAKWKWICTDSLGHSGNEGYILAVSLQITYLVQLPPCIGMIATL